MIFITWTLGVALFLTLATFFVDFIISAPPARSVKSDHFNGKTFSNINNRKARGFKDILKWAVNGDPGKWRRLRDKDVTFSTPQRLISNKNKALITFVNHSTFLVQTHGLNILTDPIWSDRASPFQWVGPKRMRPPGVRFDDLPRIDLVLISHNHYDHLDLKTVIELNEQFEPLFVVPLGVGRFLRNHGIYNIVELDWWQRHNHSPHLSVTGVPAQHFSGRGLTDRDKTMWCGYVLELSGGNIFFAGDTGYDGFFTEIAGRFSPIHTALIPIGAYRPRWFMKPIHVNPEEAVKIHRDLNASLSLGMHFGTFPLADDGMNEPLDALAEARANYGIPETEFRTLNEGDSISVRLNENKLHPGQKGTQNNGTGRIAEKRDPGAGSGRKTDLN